MINRRFAGVLRPANARETPAGCQREGIGDASRAQYQCPNEPHKRSGLVGSSAKGDNSVEVTEVAVKECSGLFPAEVLEKVVKECNTFVIGWGECAREFDGFGNIRRHPGKECSRGRKRALDKRASRLLYGECSGHRRCP
jgi:hypothetical protein